VSVIGAYILLLLLVVLVFFYNYYDSSFVPTTSKLAEQESREVSLTTVILYSPASDLSVLMIDSEYLSPSDVIENLSLLADSSEPSLYLWHTHTHSTSLAWSF